MTEQPTTAAGLALYLSGVLQDDVAGARILPAILAIEAEARQQDASALRAVRATLAGLSLPLGTTREVAQHERDTALAIIDAAIAALPPSAPPALDVERLAGAYWTHRESAHQGPPHLICQNRCLPLLAAEYARLQEPDR